MEWLKILEGGSYLAVIVAAVVAFLGVNVWRREHPGKRRMELAEEVLTMFYEVQAAFLGVRAPFSFEVEKPRVIPPDEKPEEAMARDIAYATRRRLEDHAELFARLYAARFRFMAVFGKAESEPFVEIHHLKLRLIVASQIYVEQLNRVYTLGPQDDIAEFHKNRVQLFKTLYCVTGDSDDFSMSVDAAVKKIEKVCNDAIQTKSTRFEWLMDRLTLTRS